MMQLIIRSVLIIAVFAIVSATVAQTRQRVSFAKGNSSAVVTGTIRGYAYRDYIVRAESGQTIELEINSTGSRSTFAVFMPDGESVDEALGSSEFSGVLLLSGDYVVRVLMMRSAARRRGSTSNFTLDISIK
ncbi:MAG: hypothetical protein WBO10_04680 [Pyrinomonadaceae bacterium]